MMSLYNTLKQRFRDMGTLKTLCLSAESHANAQGHTKPAAEHLVLAALDLPDGTARQVFERLRLDHRSFGTAIDQQYQDALRSIGIQAPAHAAPGSSPVAPAPGLYDMQASGQVLMQQLVEQRKKGAVVPLLGAHVIMAACRAQHGVAPRALRAMGVEPEAMAAAAEAEIMAYCARAGTATS